MMSDLDYQYIASLVEYAKEGNSDAFAELYVATYQNQYRFAYSYLEDERLAQDALLDTYVLVLKNIAALKDANLFVSWLNQITFRVCFKLRKNKQIKENSIPEYDDLDPEEDMISIEGHDFIIRQVMKLPFTESQIIILRYYNHLEIKDISRLMDISRNSVKKYLSSGYKKLELLKSKKR